MISKILTTIMATLNIFMGVTLYIYLLRLKTTIPMYINWLAKGLMNIILGAVILLIMTFRGVTIGVCIFNYLYMYSLYLFAMWQTKFSISNAKGVQKLYILFLNSLSTLICIKYIMTFAKDALGSYPMMMTKTSPVYISITTSTGVVFLVFYIIFSSISLRFSPKKKFRRLIFILIITLGVMIFYNMIQLTVDTSLEVYFPYGIFSKEYYTYFEWNSIIKLFMTFIYMLLIGAHVIRDRGRYLTDTLGEKEGTLWEI